MKKTRWWLAVLPAAVVAAVATAVILGNGRVVAQEEGEEGEQEEYVGVAEVRDLMAGINGPNFGGLRGLLQAGPPNAEAWDAARHHASLLAENGYLLSIGDRPLGEEWIAAAAQLRAAGMAAADACADQDLSAARAALGQIGMACGACHETYR